HSSTDSCVEAISPARLALPRRSIDRFAVVHRYGPRVDAQNPLNRGRLLGKLSQLILSRPQITQPPWNADVGLQPFDRRDRPLRRRVLAQPADVLAQPF